MTHYLIEFRFFGKEKLELKNLIREFRREFKLRRTRCRPIPHVTLVESFYTINERRLISDFEELCSKQPMMLFKTKGFGVFDGSRVVFIDIEPDETLDNFRWELSKKLRGYCKLSPRDLERKFSFHATIAMKLRWDKFNFIKSCIDGHSEPELTHCVMRVTLLKGQKILREYDFSLRGLLNRREAKSRPILSESYNRLPNYCKEKVGNIVEVDTNNIGAEGEIFLISDLHLDHGRIIGYCNRPFKSVGEMNDFIVNTWNKTVSKNDIVFFLGDMACGRGSRKTRYWLNKLNGNITFIKGHHDRSRRINFRDKLILNCDGQKFLLLHNPADTPRDWKSWVIHGHTHNNNPRYPLVSKKNKTVNVSAELLDYKPVLLEELIGLIGSKKDNSNERGVDNNQGKVCSYCGKKN